MPGPVDARVDAGIWLHRDQLGHRLGERIHRAFSVANPAYRQRTRLGKAVFGVPERLYFTQDHDEWVRVPRGAVHQVRDMLLEDGRSLRFDDRRVLPDVRLPTMPDVGLRDYQQSAAAALVHQTQGLFVGTTGSGKTRVGLGAIAELRTPTLVLVGARDLAEQWQREIRGVLKQDAGLVAGGSLTPAPVTVALVQALTRWERPRLDSFLARFGFLVIDEAHHCPSRLFSDVVDRSPSKYRLGLSATPEREDGLTPLLELFLGQVLATVDHRQLVERGLLILPELRVVETGFEYPYSDADDYPPMLEALALDEQRNQLVSSTVAAEAQQGATCLVLSGRRDHCDLLAAQLRGLGADAEILTSDVPRARRAKLLEAARSGRQSVLIATSLADEGLDLPRLSRVFLAFPSKAKGRTLQRVGRVMRPHAGKDKAVLFDFVDGGVPVLRRHARERQRVYRTVLGIHPQAQRSAA
jgi:superfamily II DNA or RNA helicase